MTYVIRHKNGVTKVENSDGDVIKTVEGPFTVPQDIVDCILNDMGVGEPQREALHVLFSQDWIEIYE